MALGGGLVEAPGQLGVGRGQLGAAHGAQRDALLGRGAALALELVAPLAVEAREVVGVVAVARVSPMVLQRRAAEEVAAGEALRLFFWRKEDVQRREALVAGEVIHRREELRALVFVGDEEAAGGQRRERQAHQQLRVIRYAEARGGVGPAEVVDVLAQGMVLQVRGRGRDQSLAVPEGEVSGLPAARRRGGAGLFHGRQPFPAQHRGVVGAEQRIPEVARHLGDGVEHAEAERHCVRRNRCFTQAQRQNGNRSLDAVGGVGQGCATHEIHFACKSPIPDGRARVRRRLP